jgi:hypothetical protein
MWQLLIPIIGNVFDKIFPDKTKADEAKARLIELQMNGELQQIMGQLDINKAEAASGNAYASSWRPTIGYICDQKKKTPLPGEGRGAKGGVSFKTLPTTPPH